MISRKRLTSFSFAALLILLGATFATAQQPQAQYKPLYPSQKASVMQTIGVTDVTNTYGADKNWDEALKYVDLSIKAKPTFRNLSAKANILRNAGKNEEALAAADQAIAKGKADGVDTTAFEKRVAGWKTGT